MKYIPRGSHIFLTHTDDASKIIMFDEHKYGGNLLTLSNGRTYELIWEEPLDTRSLIGQYLFLVDTENNSILVVRCTASDEVEIIEDKETLISVLDRMSLGIHRYGY